MEDDIMDATAEKVEEMFTETYEAYQKDPKPHGEITPHFMDEDWRECIGNLDIDMRCSGSDGHSNCLIQPVELSKERSVSWRNGRAAAVGGGIATS
jgi:hypothetical protein